MVTTAAGMNTQLTADKTTQTNTVEPSLKTRELARFLSSAIHYYYQNHFHTKLNESADINFSGLDDRGQYVHPPLIDAILSSNTWAFDELLKRGVDIHKGGQEANVPLFEAASKGNIYMVRELLRHGADPLDYQEGTCLPLMLETIHSGTLLESQSRWRYENELPNTDNTALKKQIFDFFLQEGAYTPPKPNVAIPFVAPEHVIHAHYRGKLEILGLLLSRHVSPTIPVSETSRSPLALVQNPTKYSAHFRSASKEKLEYIGTESENPNVLLFTMTLINKRNTGTSSTIVVHYDLEPSRKLIEGAVAHLNPYMLAVTQSLSHKVEEEVQQGMRETRSKLNTQLSSAQDELKEKLEKAQLETARLQAELAKAQNQTAHLAETVEGVDRAVKKVDKAVEGVDKAVQKVRDVGRFDEKDEIERFKLFIKEHPNAEEAYNAILSRLKSIHKSAQAVAGGGVVVSEGSLGLVAKVLGVSTEIVDAIPLVGSAASKFFGLAASATRQADSVRQTNIYENIAAMVPPTGSGRIFESVARKLTMAYLPEFQRLQTKEEARAQMSRPAELVQNTLKGRFISPAERVATFAIIWMIDDVFNNMHQLEKGLKKSNGLETLLLNVVTQHKPEQGVETFWNTIMAKLDMNQIPTRTLSGAISAETWHPADFWTRPGVKVEDGQGNALYFAGNGTNPTKFGFRLGSLEDVDALGLIPATEIASLSQAAMLIPAPTPSANSSLTVALPPSPTVMYAYPNVPRASANSNTTGNPGSSTQPLKSALKPDNPPAPKRNRSPLGRLKACLTAS